MALPNAWRYLGGGLVAAALVATPGPGATVPAPAGEAARSPAAGPGPADVTVVLRPVKVEHCRGERVAVDCIIENVSKHEYDMFLSYGNDFSPFGPEQHLHVAVTRDGKPVPRTLFGGSLGGASGSDKGFGPGSRVHRRFSLNAIDDMTLAGEYRVAAIAPVGGRATPGAGTPSFLARSAPVVVRVVGDCPGP